MGGARKTDSGVQAQAQTNESDTQTERPRKTFEAGTQSEPRVNTKGTQATEDKSEEIEKLKRASELEQQALIDQQAKNIEQVRQQVRAEAETAHEMRKQEYLQEAMHRENIVGTEAQRTINQINQTAQQRAQESVRQEAHQYTATLFNFAENQYQSKMGAAKAQAEKDAKAAKAQAKKEAAAAKEQAEKEAAAAKEQAEKEAKAAVAKAKKEAEEATKRAKASEKSEHNTEHKSERTPDTRAPYQATFAMSAIVYSSPQRY
jgi:colicin import membrane protein